MFNGESNEKERLLSVIYMFLSSENRINDADYSLFEEAGKSIEGFSELKGGLIGECEKNLTSEDSKLRFEIVSMYFLSFKNLGGAINKIKNDGSFKPGTEETVAKAQATLGDYNAFIRSFRSALSGNENQKRAFLEKRFSTTLISDNESRAILWTLIKLFRGIEDKSEKKQQLIDLWVETNQIDKSITLEMIDTCETENALLGFNNWLETNKSYQEVDSIKQELKKNQISLKESMNNLIVLG